MILESTIIISMAFTPQIEFKTAPYNPVPAYWIDYFEAAGEINRDRETTLRFLKRGYLESNPLLGQRPSKNRVNLMIGSIVLLPMLMQDFPDWLKSSIAKSIAYTVKLHADSNERLLAGDSDPPSGWPQHLVIIFTARW